MPLIVQTAKWGDITLPMFPGAPSTQPNFSDISAVVDAFKGIATAPDKTRAKLVPDVIILSTSPSFLDISAAVSGFVRLPYAYPSPAPCP